MNIRANDSSTLHEALKKPVLWAQVPTTPHKQGFNYHLYFSDRGQRTDARIALKEFYPNEKIEVRSAPHRVNGRDYYTIHISRELGTALERLFPETHKIGALLERGGVRTSETTTGIASTEKLEAALPPDLGTRYEGRG